MQNSSTWSESNGLLWNVANFPQDTIIRSQYREKKRKSYI